MDEQRIIEYKQQYNQDEQNKQNGVEPGMIVETTGGDIGDTDISKPEISDVVRDRMGRLKRLVVRKGVLFRKELEIPADRVQKVEEDERKVIVDVGPSEADALTATGAEILPSEKEIACKDVLDQVETAIPTEQGLREMELGRRLKEQGYPTPTSSPPTGRMAWLRVLGPGFLGGMAGNDASAVVAYALNGATNGFGYLWLLLLTTPMYQAVLYACAKIGRVSQKGLAELLREHYGFGVSVVASIVLIIANIATIAADLTAIGSGFSLIIGWNWTIFVVPVAAVLWYLIVYHNFETFKKIFLVMSLVFVVYIITAFMAHPAWSSVLLHTFVPQLNFNFASVSSALALLGATLSPYSMYWQVQGEKEQERPGNRKQQLRFATLDITSGVVSGNLVAYFIIISTAATLYVHHQRPTTAAAIALSLVPVLGPFARYLFAIGIIGAGLVAIPVLLASTSYAVAGTFGWPAGLSHKPWQSEGFYVILTVALGVSLSLALLRVDPIMLLFWANILAGMLAPVLVIYLLLVGNNKNIMKQHRLGWLTNAWLLLACLVLLIGTVLLLYGLYMQWTGRM